MTSRFIRWAHSGLRLVVEIPVDAPVRIAQLDTAASPAFDADYTERI